MALGLPTRIARPIRHKHSEAAIYLAPPVINRAPKRSPTDDEMAAILENLRRLPSPLGANDLGRFVEKLYPDVGVTYALKQRAVLIFTTRKRPV
jgi:hypothetical protein